MFTHYDLPVQATTTREKLFLENTAFCNFALYMPLNLPPVFVFVFKRTKSGANLNSRSVNKTLVLRQCFRTSNLAGSGVLAR